MEETLNKTEELIAVVKEYVHNRVESAKLNVAEKSSAVIADLVAGAIAVVVFFGFIVFAGVALSLGLGEWLGKPWLGFLIVACLYLLVGIIVWKARTKLIRIPLMNAILQQLFKDEDQ
jgi:hypothetical protein